MSWTGVITNGGAALLDQWALGGTLTITGAAAGTGTAAESTLRAQTALVDQRQTAGVLSAAKTEAGLKVKLQLTAPEEGYTLNQYGIWARLDSESPVLLALYQNAEGVTIPSAAEIPEFVYTPYALLKVANTGELTVRVDPDTLVTYDTLRAAVAAEASVRTAEDEAIREQMTSPFNFRGTVADLTELEAITNPAQNDTYYVEALKCRYSWTGSAWKQSSMSESDYTDQLGSVSEQTEFLAASLRDPAQIAYWGMADARAVYGSTVGEQFIVTQNKNRITVTGVNAAVYAAAKLDKKLQATGGRSTVAPDRIRALTKDIPLRSGRIYRLRADYVSGSWAPGATTSNADFRVIMYTEPNEPIGHVILADTAGGSALIEPEDDVTVNLVVRSYGTGNTFTDYTWDIILEDVTQDTKGETVDEVARSVKEISSVLTGDRSVSLHYEASTAWFVTDGYAARTPQDNAYVGFDPVPAESRDYFSLHIYSGHSTKQWPLLIADENYRVLEAVRLTRDKWCDYDFVCPEGTAWLLLTTSNNSHGNDTTLTRREVIDVAGELETLTAGRYDFAGKTVAILGDSVDTNGDYSADNPLGNVPELVITEDDVGVELSAYATYFDTGKTIGGRTILDADIGTEVTVTPAEEDVGKTLGKPKNNNAASVKVWWEAAAEVLGFLPRPVAWSGSSVTRHEEADPERKASYAWHPAQIRKCGIRTPGTMERTAPDMIIVARGANDLTHSPYPVLTDILERSVPRIPETDEVTVDGATKYGFIEGLMLTVSRLQEAYPSARIVLATIHYIRRVHGIVFPTYNVSDTLQDYNAAIRKVADYFGLPVIAFDKCGLNFWNASGEYYQDGERNYTHPTTKGHKILGNRAIIDLRNINSLD